MKAMHAASCSTREDRVRRCRPSMDYGTRLTSLLHCHTGPPRICWSGSRKVASALGTWLGDRPLRRLFRYHSYVLPRLASAAPGWGSARDLRGTAGGVASVYAGSLVLLPGGGLQRSGSGG